MIAGHFGLAAAIKAHEPATPLWSLMLATVWLDVVFALLFASGVEHVESVSGASRYGGLVIHADYSHSFVGAVLLSVLLGLPFALAWGARSGAVVGIVAFSHWVMDLVVHRADLPLLPGDGGGLAKVGFGLWRVSLASASIELILVVAGAYLYWRAARRVSVQHGRNSRLAAASGLMVLLFGCLVLFLDVTGLGGRSRVRLTVVGPSGCGPTETEDR